MGDDWQGYVLLAAISLMIATISLVGLGAVTAEQFRDSIFVVILVAGIIVFFYSTGRIVQTLRAGEENPDDVKDPRL